MNAKACKILNRGIAHAACRIVGEAGLESGPRVLCGHTRGQVQCFPPNMISRSLGAIHWKSPWPALPKVSTITLPSFEFKTAFQALPGEVEYISMLSNVFPRVRREGFPFISWGSGGWRRVCRSWLERPQPFATVRNRPQPFATVRGVPDWPCRWGKLLQVTFYDLKKCHFAPLCHCKVHQSVMLGKKRDAFHCTGAGFCRGDTFGS